MKTESAFSLVFLIGTVSWYCSFLEATPIISQSNTGYGKSPPDWTKPINTTSPKDASCYNADGQAFIDIIPHPTNCALFYKCDRYLPDLPDVIAFGQKCPENLYFDFNNCYCNFRDEALCFDQNNPEHVANRLKCACPLELNENGQFKSDHCNQ